MKAIQTTQASEQDALQWRELTNKEYLPRIITLSLALWLHASNSMLTATTMPSAVNEIGGLHLISWTFALYLAGSIISAASMSIIVGRIGLRTAMVRAAVIYTVGCIIVALAPSMPVLLIGRVFQGLGGGSMVALVYIAQNRFFPNRLVPKIVALHSIVWILAAFSGPAIGGAFATWGLWRMAFWFFAIQGLLLIPAVFSLLKEREKILSPNKESIPIFRILFLTATILLYSLSAAHFHPIGSPVLIALGCITLALFIQRDASAKSSRILPPQVLDLNHPMSNGLIATFILSISIMSFLVYGPFILIQFYKLTPLEAGFVVLSETFAWGAAAVLMSGVKPSTEPVVIRIGSAMVIVGLAALSITFPYFLLVPTILAVIVGNFGMGMMWGYIIKRVIGSSPADQKDRTASMLPITQQTGFALGAALSGLIANSFGLDSDSSGETVEAVTFWLFAAFIPLVFIGNWFSWRFASRAIEQP
ncbi:MAG: MFS family permease [Gammaproteobacteria bacterium]|jgi:MFS family permease